MRPSEKQAIERAVKIIKECGVFNCPTTYQLSKKVKLNEVALKKCFKKVTGESIHQYFIIQKMEIAKELLRTTNDPIKSIHEKAGYETMANFITMFKKYVGVTPKTYRIKNSINED